MNEEAGCDENLMPIYYSAQYHFCRGVGLFGYPLHKKLKISNTWLGFQNVLQLGSNYWGGSM